MLTSCYVLTLWIGNEAYPSRGTTLHPFQSVAEAECRRASDAAEQAYLQAFNRECQPEEAAFAREQQVRR